MKYDTQLEIESVELGGKFKQILQVRNICLGPTLSTGTNFQRDITKTNKV